MFLYPSGNEPQGIHFLFLFPQEGAKHLLRQRGEKLLWALLSSLFCLQVWDGLSEDKQINASSTITPQASSELSYALLSCPNSLLPLSILFWSLGCLS